MKNIRLVCLALAMVMLSGCAVVSTAPESYPGYYASPKSYPSYYASPSLVVIPGTYVYVAPDLGADLYFHVGYWWRLSDGLWYRSHHYDRDWSRYRGIPVFYHQIDPGWRSYYAKRQWRGHPWHYERIPAHRVQQEWSRWESTRHWEKRNNWGVQGWSATGHRQRIDAASPSARTALREPDRHQEYRTDRVRGENVDARPPRLDTDRTRRDHTVRQPHNTRSQRDAFAAGTQGGERLVNRPERRQQDFAQRHVREDVTRRDPENSQPQNGRQWQEQRQERQEMSRQSQETRQSQDGRRGQERPQRQDREEVTRQSPENSQPQDGRRWQSRPQRQELVVNAEAQPNPDQYRQRAHKEDRQPRAERRPRRDGEDSSNALPQPGPDGEIAPDSISHNP